MVRECPLPATPVRPLLTTLSRPSPRGSILVVDDDHAVRELFALALDDTYDVKYATTVAEALGILRREAVAAVVLDYRLPDGTGLEVLDDIKSTQPRVPVIMITGYGSEWICASAFKHGVRDYFPKPMNVLELVHSLGRALSRRPGEGVTPGDAEGDWTHPPASPEWLVASRPDMPIQRAIQLIHHRYWDRLSLAWLAREVGVSKYQLSHRFTRVIGLPFRAYLLTVRLERGKELLSVGQASITEVAQAVGFSDLPRFDKLFKRYTGLTPSAYRDRAVELRANARGPSARLR